MKIYVASSWRNKYQPSVVQALRASGHEVYDFRNPEPGNNGFHWSKIDPNWQQWTAEAYRDALDHRVVKDGFDRDFAAMQWADVFVLVLPCGRSAHLEAGWAIGAGKPTAILQIDREEPELMYKLAAHDALLVSLSELEAWADRTSKRIVYDSEAAGGIQ